MVKTIVNLFFCPLVCFHLRPKSVERYRFWLHHLLRWAMETPLEKAQKIKIPLLDYTKDLGLAQESQKRSWKQAGLDVLEYDTRNQRYRIHFSKDEIQKHERLLKEILGRAHREFSGDNAVGKWIYPTYIFTSTSRDFNQKSIAYCRD